MKPSRLSRPHPSHCHQTEPKERMDSQDDRHTETTDKTITNDIAHFADQEHTKTQNDNNDHMSRPSEGQKVMKGDHMRPPPTPRRLREEVEINERRHTCTSRRTDNDLRNHQRRLVESLTAPRGFLRHITVEPVAFLAVLAVLIEFIAIQDLIYTKICLETVAKHPELTRLAPNGRINNLPNSIIEIPRSHPSDLKIDQLDLSIPAKKKNNITTTAKTRNLSTVNTTNLPITVTDQTICDRFNKTLIPDSVSREIVHLDSLFWLRYQIVVCLLCAIACPCWGGISDRIGRIAPLNVAISMTIVTNLLSLGMAILIQSGHHKWIAVEWLFIGATLIGLAGGQAVVMMNLFSYISDQTSPESRLKRITILEACIYLGNSLGYLVNKYVMGISLGPSDLKYSWSHLLLNRHFIAFSMCILLGLICITYSSLKLRHQRFHRFLNNFEREQRDEIMATTTTSAASSICGGSLPRDDSQRDRTLRELTASTPDDIDGPIARSDKRVKSWRSVLTLEHYGHTLVAATEARETRPLILATLSCGFISAAGLATMMSLLFIYLRNEPFKLTSSQYSSWKFTDAIINGTALVGLTLCMRFVRGWNVPDPLMSALGFLSKSLGFLVIGLAQSGSGLNWALVVLVFSEFTMPPIRALLSKLVPSDELSKIYSCLAAIQSLCFLFGNIILYLAYSSLGLERFYRATFLAVSGLQFIAVIIMILIYVRLRQKVVVV